METTGLLLEAKTMLSCAEHDWFQPAPTWHSKKKKQKNPPPPTQAFMILCPSTPLSYKIKFLWKMSINFKYSQTIHGSDNSFLKASMD